MSYVDDFARFVAAFEPKPEPVRSGWKALAILTAVCLVALALVLLATTGPSDAVIG